MAGLRQLNQTRGLHIVTVKPQVMAEDLLVPVGALGDDGDGVAVGRESDIGKADRVEKFVEGQCRFGLSLGKYRQAKENKSKVPESHKGKEVYTTADSIEANQRAPAESNGQTPPPRFASRRNDKVRNKERDEKVT